MTTLALRARNSSHKLKALALPNINWSILYVPGILLIAAALVFYIYSINELTMGSYTIKNYNKSIDAMMADNRALETNFAESGFLGNVQEKVGALDFEKTTQVTYVQILDNSLGMVR